MVYSSQKITNTSYSLLYFFRNLIWSMAKLPLTFFSGMTLSTTVDPIVTQALSPISTPFATDEPGPINTFSPIVTFPAINEDAAKEEFLTS